MGPYFNPTLDVVTFRLRGWCVLGVFLFSVFTCLGHECQDLLSPCSGMHVRTDGILVYTLIQKTSWEWSQNPCQLQGKNTGYETVEPAMLHHAG